MMKMLRLIQGKTWKDRIRKKIQERCNGQASHNIGAMQWTSQSQHRSDAMDKPVTT